MDCAKYFLSSHRSTHPLLCFVVLLHNFCKSLQGFDRLVSDLETCLPHLTLASKFSKIHFCTFP
jgi:hypothetical protein